MMHYRYGRFKISDYWMSLVAITVLVVFAFASIMLKLSILFVFFPLIYAFVWLWVILASTCERFTLCDDTIVVSRGKQSHTITLPLELTLVISYADICPPLARRTAFGKQTHILKQKYAVSILRRMPLEDTLEALHRNYVQIYTTSTIQTVFEGYLYIYGFVCNRSLLAQLTNNRRCHLIIPESLSALVGVDWIGTRVHIDKGY